MVQKIRKYIQLRNILFLSKNYYFIRENIIGKKLLREFMKANLKQSHRCVITFEH